MAVESAHMADLNKMAAPKPADPSSPGKVRSPAPENFKGCECLAWRCRNRNCPCKAASYPCTSNCKCVGCVVDDTGSDSNTGAVTWCKCKVSRCWNKNCRCVKDSHRCSSKCECKDCWNSDGVRGTDEAVHTTPPANSEPEITEDDITNKLDEGHTANDACVCRLLHKPSSGIDPEQADTSSRRCSCMRGSFRCSSNCECKNCANRPGGRESDEALHTTSPSNTEPEIFDDDSKKKITELFTDFTEDDINKFPEDDVNNKVTEMWVVINNGGSDLNKLP